MSDARAIHALVADDEPPARAGLLALLARQPGWRASEAASGSEALARVADGRPDVLFLDVRMPGLDGVEVARRLAEVEPRPLVVFVTAFAQHAVDAFELEAVDYLLKPFDQARFDRAIRRVEGRLAAPSSVVSVPKSIESRSASVEQLVVRSLTRTRFVPVGDVVWIAAEGNYVRLYLREQCLLHRTTMVALERELDPEQFLRVQRGAIVNRREIAELRTPAPGRHLIGLRDGSEVEISQRYARRVLERLGVRSSG